MKKVLLSIAWILSVFCGLAQNTGDERILLSLETQLTEAIAAHKDVFLNNLFDESYHGVTPSGSVVDKAKWLELLKTNNPYVIFNTEDVKATIYGATAVVTGRLMGKSKSGSVIGQSRFLHVFIKRGDQWKIVEEQSTLVIQQ